MFVSWISHLYLVLPVEDEDVDPVFRIESSDDGALNCQLGNDIYKNGDTFTYHRHQWLVS